MDWVPLTPSGECWYTQPGVFALFGEPSGANSRAVAQCEQTVPSPRPFNLVHLLASLEFGGVQSVARWPVGGIDRAWYRSGVCALDGPGGSAMLG